MPSPVFGKSVSIIFLKSYLNFSNYHYRMQYTCKTNLPNSSAVVYSLFDKPLFFISVYMILDQNNPHYKFIPLALQFFSIQTPAL